MLYACLLVACLLFARFKGRGVQNYFWENTFLTHFGRFFVHKMAHFQGFSGPERAQNGSKPAQNGLISLVCAPQMVKDHLWKNTFLTHFWVPKRLIFKAFWDFPRAKTRHRGLKTGEKQLFVHPKWSRNHLAPRGPWWTHRWPPPYAAQAALQLHQVTSGTGCRCLVGLF